MPEELCALTVYLLEVKPALRAEKIERESSLTHDLGLDSLDLMRLAARIRDDHPDLDLRAWLAHAFRTESDSVGSMAELLTRTPTPQR